jgi:hypothetical protein
MHLEILKLTRKKLKKWSLSSIIQLIKRFGIGSKMEFTKFL